MNDEIREILENMKEISSFEYTTDWFELNCEDTKILLDYITNLQQENEKIRMRNDMLRKDIDSFIQDNKIDYKSRVEKAIEFIKEAIENDEYFEDDIATDISEPSYDKYVNSNSLLNILQNGSEK